VPRKIPAIKVLTIATTNPENGDNLIIANKVITFARPGFNQGTILGRGDSMICNAAAVDAKTAIKVYFFTDEISLADFSLVVSLLL
jgi:hypothetical protein